MKYLNAYNTIPGLGQKTLAKIAASEIQAENIWKLSANQLINLGISDKLAQKIITLRSLVNPDLEWEKLEKENIITITQDSSLFPPLLKQIPDCPYIIYTKGNLDCLNLSSISIVGSRKFTSYGKQVALALSRDLAKNGVCVVSGLAFGIDAAAHRGTIDAHGKTIAVLGNSLDNESIAPRSNFNLSEEIIVSGGLLLSDFPLVTPASPGTFPARNRIIAGLSLATIVVEAAEKSGSLITAQLALDYNRDVFAVPGSIFSPSSIGTNQLIKAGAKLTMSASDVLEELRLNSVSPEPKNITPAGLSKEENLVLTFLSHESLHIDRIIKMTRLETSRVISTLTMLEIKGVIKNIGGQNYIKL